MQPASSKILIYLQDLYYLIEILKSVEEVGLDNYLFTTDAIAMYPNIDKEEAIAALTTSFHTNLVEYNQKLQLNALIKALQLLMQHNVFRFGNTYYCQKNGATIGLLPALDIATQVYGFYEAITINSIFIRYLRVDSRIIDDKLSLWNRLISEFKAYKTHVNKACKLD